MKKDDFLVIVICMNSLSYIFCNFFILFKKDLFNGFTFDISNFLFPFLYISTDLIQEIYGYKKSRLTAQITIASQIIFALFCLFSIKYFNITWLDKESNQIIKENILGSIASIITVASIISYYLGGLTNNLIFAKLNNMKDSFIDYSKRAFISSILQKLVDSFIFNLILITLPNSNFTLKLVLIPIILELLIEFIFLPINHRIVMKIKNILKKA